MSPLVRLFLATSLVTFIACLAMGFYIYWYKPSRKNRAFLIYNLNVVFWSLGMIAILASGDNVARIDTLIRATTVMGIFVPSTLYYFSVTVADRYERHRRGVFLAFLFSSLLSLTTLLPDFLVDVSIVSIGDPSHGLYFPDASYGPSFLFTVVFASFLLFYTLHFLRRRKRELSGLKRTEIEYIFLGLFAMAMLSITLVLVLPALGIAWLTPLGPFSVFLMNGVIAYGIARHRILDTKLVLNRAFVYALLTVLLAVVYIGVVLLYNWLFGQIFPGDSMAPHLLAAVCIALLVAPARERIQQAIDRLYYRGRTRPEEVLREVSEILTAQEVVPEFLAASIGKITSFLGVGEAAVVLWHREKETFAVESAVGEKFTAAGLFKGLARERTFIEELRREKVIVREEWERLPSSAGQQEVVRVLRSLAGEVCAPVVMRGELLAFILLGRKGNRRMFTGRELELVQALAGQVAMVIRNRELFRQLQRAERLVAVGTLAAGMAHEIRNPLVSIKTFVQLIPEKFSDPEFRDDFSRVATQEVERINSTIGDLLDLAHPAVRESRPVDLPALIKRGLFLLSNETHHKEIVVRQKFLGPQAHVIGDESSLQRCFLNLFRNALQAMGRGGHLVVTTCYENSSGRVVVRVSDTGEGISPEHLPRIFDFFYTGRADGTGLGLAIVHSIVTEHGGEISVESQPGRGTIFTLSFPAAPAGS